jgi:hypothetical protein
MYKKKFLKYNQKIEMHGGAQHIPEIGVRKKIKNISTNKCLDDSRLREPGLGNENKGLTVWNCNANFVDNRNPNQEFQLINRQIDEKGNTYYNIKKDTEWYARNNGGEMLNLCVEKNDEHQKYGYNICNDNDNQLFELIEGKYYGDKRGFLLKNKNTDKCIDVDQFYQEDGKSIHYWECDVNNDNQNFELIYNELSINNVELLDIPTTQDAKLKYANDMSLSTYDAIYRKNRNISEIDTLFVYFAGWFEQFGGINKLFKCNSHIIYFRDKDNKWYNSMLSNIINYIKDYIRVNNIKKTILFGQSMGGYASLYCSAYINNALCIAFNPQTFDRNVLKNKGGLMKPEPIFDIRELLISNINNTKKYILVGKTEGLSDYIWEDLLYTGYLHNIPNVSIIISPKQTHPLWGCVKPDAFYSLIFENFNRLYISLDNGDGAELLNNLEYFEKC